MNDGTEIPGPDGSAADVELTRTHRRGHPATGPEPGRLWGEFQIIRELGRGAFGRVYHAWDSALARDIALKVVRLPDTTLAATALAEGRMLARVRHRNVVTVYGALQIGDEVGFWMELVEGRHLGQVIRENGRMDAATAARVGISLCQALAAVHHAGLLHRDVKANNVMQDVDGRIVLMDFGTGRETAHSEGEDFAGTPVYMAPEVLKGHTASVQSDLYSLGVLLYFLVTAEYPHSGTSVLDLVVAHRATPRRSLGSVRPDLPDAFVAIVEHALATQPSLRPESAVAMMQALQATLPSAVPPPRANVMPEIGRIAIGVALAVVAIFTLGLLTSVAFNQSLQREGGFSEDRWSDWWTYGVRSLVAPVVYAAVLLLTGRVALGIWHLTRRVVPGLRRTTDMLTSSVSGLFRVVGATSGASIGHWVVGLSLTALLMVWWHYDDLLYAVVFPNVADRSTLHALEPESLQPLTYRGALTTAIVAMVLSWQALRSRPNLWATIDRATRSAGLALIICAVLLLEVPYRLLYQNERRRVDLAEARCYELGTSETGVLLYCPDSPPRIQIVPIEDSRLRRLNTVESIFTVVPSPR